MRLKERFQELRELLEVKKTDRATLLQFAIERLVDFDQRVQTLESEKAQLLSHVNENGPSFSGSGGNPLEILQEQAGRHAQSIVASNASASWPQQQPQEQPQQAHPPHEGTEPNAEEVTSLLQLTNQLSNGLADALFGNFGAVLISLNGIYLDANQKFQDMIGHDRAHLQMTTMFALTHPEDLRSTYRMVQKVLSRQAPAWCISKRYVHKDGSAVPVQLMFTMVSKLHNGIVVPSHFAAFMVNQGCVSGN